MDDLLRTLSLYVKESNHVVQVKYTINRIYFTTILDPRNLDLGKESITTRREEVIQMASAFATEVAHVVSVNFKTENIEFFCKPLN